MHFRARETVGFPRRRARRFQRCGPCAHTRSDLAAQFVGPARTCIGCRHRALYLGCTQSISLSLNSTGLSFWTFLNSSSVGYVSIRNSMMFVGTSCSSAQCSRLFCIESQKRATTLGSHILVFTMSWIFDSTAQSLCNSKDRHSYVRLCRGLLFDTFLITVWYKLCRYDHSVLKLNSFSPPMNL